MFRSRLIWIAGLLFLAHILALITLGTRPPGPFLSNLIELSFGVLAVVAAYLAGQRSGPFGRRVWWFATVALGVWTIAQGIITYYERVLHASYDVMWPSDLLVFFWVLPLIMALFLAVSKDQKRTNPVQILDFAQIVILMLAAYVAYLYVPSQWAEAGQWMAKLGWDATNIRDAVLVGGLTVRGFHSRSKLVRNLFLRLAGFFVFYQIADLVYHYVEEVQNVTTGSPWDLLWSAPFVVAVVVASSWQHRDESELAQVTGRRHKIRQLLFLSSAFLPLPVLFVAFEVQKETPLLGAALVVASLLCSASRLLITQRRRDQSEDALLHSEKEFKEAQRLAQIGSWEWDVSSDIVYWSDELYRMARRDRNLPPPRFSEFSKVYPPATMERLTPLVDEAVRSGTPYTLEMERILPDGTKKSFTARGEPVRDQSGRVVRLRGTVQDITDRKQAEVALQESEERFRGLSDAAFEGVAFSDAGKVVLANARLTEMLGCSMEELIGSNVSDWIAPEFRESVMERVRGGSEGTYEHYLRRKDDSTFPVESRARHLPWKGKSVRVTAIRDITERKSAEQMLRTLTEATAAVMGSEFFISLVKHSSAALNARFAFVAERLPGDRVRMLANWAGDVPAENFVYNLKDTPCEGVLKGETCFYREHVQALFPSDRGLAKLAVDSYLGVPLFDNAGRVIGHLAVLDTKPMPDDSQALSILEISAARAGAELERKRALEAVQQEKAFSDAVIDSLPGFVYVVDSNGQVIRWNKHAETILGYSREELLAMNTIDVVAEEDHELVAARLLEAYDKGHASCEARVLTKDARSVPFLLSAVRTGIGENLYIIGAGIDITERKRAEEALRESEELFRQMASNSPYAFFLWDVRDERHVYINPAYETIWGQPPESLYADPMAWKKAVHPEDRARMQRRVLGDFQSHPEREGIEDEFRVVRPDGAIRWVHLNRFPVRNENGEVYRIGLVAHDVTERKEVEEALVKLKKAVDTSGEVIFMTDRFGIFTSVNPEFTRLYGYTAEEVVGKVTPRILKSDSTNPEDHANLWKAVLDKRVFQHEIVNKAKDGRLVNIETSVNAVVGDGGEILGFLAIQRDIAERKRAEEALQAEKAFSEAVIDSLPGAFFVGDMQGRMIRWNKNVEDIGYSSEELAAMAPGAIVAPEDRAIVAAAREKVLTEGSATLEANVLTKDGKRIPHFISAVRAEIGGETYIVGTGVNVAERKRAEEALRESERRYRELVDHANDIIYETDRNGRFTFVNPVATRILGYSPEELNTRHYLELIRPDFREEAERFYLKQAAEKNPSTYFQFPVVAKDGAEVWLGQHVQLAMEGDRVIGFRAIARDRTKQKIAEDALAESEERFRQMAENSPDTFWLFDVGKQTLLYVSPGFEKLWGHSTEALHSDPSIWRDAVHPEDRKRIFADWDARATTVGSQNEFRIIRPDGSVRWVNGRTFPIRDQAGQIKRLAGIAYDVTERRMAEEALRHQEKLFHAIVEDQTEMIVRWKPDGTRTFVNDAYCRMMGRTREGVVGKSFFPHLSEEDRSRIRSKIAALTPDRPTATDIHPSIPQGGSRAWHEWTDRALFDEEGRVVELQSVGRDITERKKAEEALTMSEARFRTLIESAPEAIVVLDAETRKFVDFNDNASRLFGLYGEELLKVTPVEVSPPFQPDGRPSSEAAVEYVRKAAAGEIPVFEWMHRNSQGVDIPCEVRLVRLPGTERTLLRGSVTDISSRKQAEAALRASQEMFSKAFHSSPEPMAIMTLPDWKFLDVNKATSDLIGYEREEIIGHMGNELGLASVGGVSASQLESIMQGDFRNKELDLRVKSGETRTVLISLELVEIGGKSCILAQGRDVTEHRRAEIALRASDQRYRDFISHSQEGVWRVELEPPIPADLPMAELFDRLSKHGYIAECNDALAKMFSLPNADNLVGKHIKDLGTASDEGWRESVRSAAWGGWQNRTIQFATVDRQGHPKHLQRTEIPIVEDGFLKRVWGMTRDVTDLHHAEEALRASEQRYRQLFERSVAGVFETTLDGRLLECNDAFAGIQGYTSRTEILSANIKDFFLERADGTALIELLKQQPIVMGQEFQTRRKDGTPVWMLVSASLVEDKNSQSTILATAFDITQWKELGEQLRQSQKMEAVGRLAGGVAHDFNNMLQIINGYSELVIDELPAKDPLRSHVNEIKNIVERAAGLTRQLLAFSRQQVLAPQVLDLNTSIANLSKMLRRLIGEDVELFLTEGHPLNRVKADPGQIDQVILNLAVNARDAMPQGGELTIETSNVDIDATYALGHFPMTPGPYVLVAVSDTGCGMDAETQARIFEPFFTTKEKGKGTGLGLATVYGIIKQSGGFIWAESEVDKGTTFKVFLPPAKESPTVLEASHDPTRVHGTETVLLVEDEEYVRSLVRKSLQSKGYTVLEARNGKEALSVARQHPGPIHLLITDVVMPGMSGRELAECLVPLRQEMKTLYMSGYTDDTILHHGVLDSDSALLQKPFTAKALASKVRQLLDRN
jgi:PAS domain S-box-containing protein